MRLSVKFFSIFSIFSIFAYGSGNDTAVLVESINKDAKVIEHFAEKTKLSEPYQPYIISVFRGKDLEKLGVTNLKEALLLVPGVDIATDNMDNQRLIFRGSNPFAFGQSKLFIDDVEVNDILFDSYGNWLSMPIEMVKRIEVTRGPGGISNGVNAYAGSIRVVTYAEHLPMENSPKMVVAKAGSSDYKMGGAIFRHEEENYSLHLDLYYQKDDKFLKTGKDALSTGRYRAYNESLSREGDAPLWMRSYMIGAQLKYGLLKFDARTLYNERGSAFGINGALPQPKDHAKFPFSYAQISYEKSFEDWQVHLNGGVKLSAFKSYSLLAPKKFKDVDNPELDYPDGFYGIHEVNQRQIYQSSYASYTGIESHKFDFGYYISKEKTTKEVTITTDRTDGVGLVDYSQTLPFTDPHAKRTTWRLFLQDRYRYSEKVTLQAGLNVEKNSNISTQYNPRISAVYQPDAVNVYKIIYSRSIRTPSWQEVYTLNNRARRGNHNLDPEVVNALEAAYIHMFGLDKFIQLNLFYLKNSDQIDNLNDDHQYRNSGSSDIWGATMEYKTIIARVGHLYMNFTWLNGKKSDDRPLDNAAHVLAKVTYHMPLSENWSVGAVGRYVGTKKRAWYDYRRDKVPACKVADATISYKKSGYKVQLSAKNIFDEDIRYPSEPYNYDDDFPAEGRRVMLTLTKAF